MNNRYTTAILIKKSSIAFQAQMEYIMLKYHNLRIKIGSKFAYSRTKLCIP